MSGGGSSLASESAPLSSGLRFNARASGYARHACIQRDMAAWLAQWLPQKGADWGGAAAAADAATVTVVDLGAGDGLFTQHLADRFPRVIAVDAAEQMVLAGKRRLPAVDWRCGDAWSLTDASTGRAVVDDFSKISALVSSSLLQWCAEPQQTLAGWAARCPRGTRLLHGFYTEPTLVQWREVFGNTTTIRWRTPQQWSEFFAASGWQVLRQDFVAQRYVFPSALALARSLHGTGATVTGAEALSPGHYRKLLRAYETAYAAAADALVEAPPSHSGQNAVYATWGFFRIEAVRQ